MTTPNLISIFRIILVPVFLLFIINNRFLAGLIVFVLAGVFLVLFEKHFHLFSQYVYVVYGATGTLTVTSGLL
jgi:hypothetical protein